MMERTRLVYFRVSEEEEAKLDRMRVRSRRPSIQNVLEALVATADEAAPEWNLVPTNAERQPTSRAAAS